MRTTSCTTSCPAPVGGWASAATDMHTGKQQARTAGRLAHHLPFPRYQQPAPELLVGKQVMACPTRRMQAPAT